MVLGLGKIEIVVNRNNHCGSCVATSQTVTPSNDERLVLLSVESVANIKVKGFTFSSRLFCSVENGNALNCFGNCSEEMFNGERTIKVNAHHTYFLTVGIQVINCLACCFGSRTHENYYAVCVFGTIIAEEFVFATGNFGNFLHVFLYDARNCVIVRVANLTVCEESFGVLCHAACHRVFG